MHGVFGPERPQKRYRANVQTPQVAAGPVPPAVGTDVPGGGAIPFNRAAAPPRTQIGQTTGPQILTTGQQAAPFTLAGTGYWIWLDNFINILSSGNAATVALQEDAPWSAIGLITNDDGGPQNINVTGYQMYLFNVYGGVGIAKDPSLSSDTNVYQQLSTGAGATGGSGQFNIRVPIAINERNYIGLFGNQDRATKYNLRTDIAPSTSIYSTAPTTLPQVTISRTYGFLPVPSAQSADGRPQESMPAHYGCIHYLSGVRSDAPPAGGSVVNHYIRNLANAARVLILVMRANGSRSTANGNLPSQIDFKLGTDVIFSETAAERRRLMWNRYGFDAPNGVLVYDFIHDFGPLAGFELGDQYVYLGNISEAQFAITYPSGFGSTNNSLEILTDSLFIPPGVDIYAGT
jgi:hypothetical protein